MIRAATLRDAPAIAAVYAPYVLDTVVSFEEVAPSTAGVFLRAGFKRAGFKRGRWWDVGWWQRPLTAPPAEPAEPRAWP